MRIGTSSLVSLCVLALLGCGSPPPGGPAPSDAGADSGTGTPSDGGADTDGGTGSDGGASAGPWDLPSITYVVDAGAPITAPNETWTFVSVPDAHCANGTSTGMAVNLTDRSKRVLIFLAGGGACWEAAACASGTAVHIQDTMGEAAVLGEAQGQNLAVLFDRADMANPFRDASFVYVPYCTGDLHSGTKIFTYDWFGPRPLEHVGARNMDAYLRRLQPTFADADGVWLSGVSAGGYGATFNWWRVQKAFPWARVDVLNDSGLIVDAAGDGRYGTMQARWGMEFPPGCTGCTTSITEVLEYSATQLLPAPRRYAMLGYEEDGTIALYFGLQGADVKARLNQIRSDAAPHVRLFTLTGNSHVVLTTPNVATSSGKTARQWVQAFTEDTATFAHEGP